MRVTIKTIAGLTSLAALLIGNSVFAANLILNPGFETGDTTGWSVLGASDGSAYVNVQPPATARQHQEYTTRICTM